MVEIEELAKKHRRSWPSGYRVRVTGFRLVAEPSGRSFDPRLIAELSPEGADTRIIGALHWTPKPMLVAMAAVFGLMSAVAMILLGAGGHWLLAAVAGFVSLLSCLSIVADLGSTGEGRRAAGEQQVREELRLIFFPAARREGLTSLDQLLQERPPESAG